LKDLQDKKNTVLSLIEKDNMGLINDIHDNLKRNVLITPVKARFLKYFKIWCFTKWKNLLNENNC